MNRLLPTDAAQYQRSSLHGETRVWIETNCYVDLWIEVLHACNYDPRAALAFTLSAEFEGEQWQFIKYPLEDLRSIYGIEVAELNPWRGLEYHIGEQLQRGQLLTAEVDAWFLPDTSGVSYQVEHVKTSIVVNAIDPVARSLGYFHGASYYELCGPDYDGLLRTRGHADDVLPPYVERVRFEARPSDADRDDAARIAVAQHLGRRPAENPVRAMADRFNADLEWLRPGG